jgi:2'-5' RNA ligase
MLAMTYGVFTAADREQAAAIQAAHLRFVLGQVKAGLDPAAPSDAIKSSVYNQFGVDMEAPGRALDRYFRQVRRIMDEPTTAEPVTAAADVMDGSMVALMPCEADCARMALAGGEPADQLHMTVAYLGDASSWADASRSQIVEAMRSCAAAVAPFEANGFAVSMFNPGGDSPAVVLGMSGAECDYALKACQMALAPYADLMPPQHAPHVAHVTLHYTSADTFADYMDDYVARCGPVTFDRLRVAFAGEYTDLALSGASMIAADGGEAMQPGAADQTDLNTPQPPTVIVTPIGGPLELPEGTGEGGTPCYGVAVVEGEWTGDRRQWAPGSLEFAPLPFALKWQKYEDEGHEGACVVGRVDTIVRNGQLIEWTGVLDDGPESMNYEAREICGLIDRLMVRTVSLTADDVDMVDVEVIYPQPIIEVLEPMMEAPAADPTAAPGPVTEGQPTEAYLSPGEPAEIYHHGRIRSLTIVPEAAFVEAVIQLGVPGAVAAAAVPSHGGATSDASWDGPANEARLPSPMPESTGRDFYAWIDGSQVTDGQMPKTAGKFGHHEVSESGDPGAANIKACQSGIGILNGGRGGTTIPDSDRSGVHAHLAGHLKDAGLEAPPLTAAGGPIVADGHTITIPDVPPDWWFDEPRDVAMATALTITDEGRLFGMLAPGGTGHRAFRDRRLTAPMGKVDYSRFLGRQTIVAGGGRRITGVITADCGHCPPAASADPAVRMQHYDNSCSVVADINIGENADGVWVAGALKHYVTAEQVSTMMGCALSGDWAPHPDKPGTMEFVAALLVPVPGFAMPGQPELLTASASFRVNEATGAATAKIPVLVAASTPRRYDYGPAMERLARAIGRDTRTKMLALRNRIGGEST